MSGAMKLQPPFRAATPKDALRLAEAINEAGDGLPFYLWEKAAGPRESAWDVGMARARREEGSFSYRNAIIIERDGEAAGCLIGYQLPDHPEEIPSDMPEMFRPLQDLENCASGTWYVNAVAISERYRGAGLGSRLLSVAEEIARMLGKRGISLIVSDANAGAMRLYRRIGYDETARRPIVKDGWSHSGNEWVLLIKAFL